MLFVTSGDELADREILGFDLSSEATNGMAPTLRIGGRHATVESDLPRVERLLGIDEKNRRLWSGLLALDLSGDVNKRVPLVGWFGLGPHDDAHKEQDTHSGKTPSLLGYSVGFCDRFGGALSAMAVNPQTGTVYVADNARYRVLSFQPEFHFRGETISLSAGKPAIDVIGSGGLSPLSFSISGGGLPAGLDLDRETGILSGAARDRPGRYEAEVEVRSAAGTSRGRVAIELTE
jgi:hypothetical protein